MTFLTDVSINGVLKNDGFTDLSNKVFLNTVTTTFNTGTIVDLSDVVTAMSTKFTADDASTPHCADRRKFGLDWRSVGERQHLFVGWHRRRWRWRWQWHGCVVQCNWRVHGWVRCYVYMDVSINSQLSVPMLLLII